MYRLEFTENRLPPTTNSMGRWHWTRKVRLSNEWNNIVMWRLGRLPATNAHEGGKLRPSLTRAALTLTRYSSREPDYDGLVSSFKVVIDALRHNGILLDDKRENIGVPTYAWKFAKPKEGRIHVLVESVDE